MTRPRPRDRSTSTRFTFAGQNQTEGTPPVADIVVGQEIDRRRVRRTLRRRRFRHFFPVRDRHQSISWDRSLFKRDGRGHAVRLHRSGRAERWAFPTPARHLLVQRLVARDTGARLTVMGVWVLNSWQPGPDGVDAHTPARRRIALDSLQRVRDAVQRELDTGRAVILEGDFNSISAVIDFNGLRAARARGLDRLFYGGPGLALVDGVREGPKTGVGSQMRHHSLLATFTLTTEEHP